MTYQVVLTHTDEGYSVSCPALPGWSEGDSEEEALANIRIAISEYLGVISEMNADKDVREVQVGGSSPSNEADGPAAAPEVDWRRRCVTELN